MVRAKRLWMRRVSYNPGVVAGVLVAECAAEAEASGEVTVVDVEAIAVDSVVLTVGNTEAEIGVSSDLSNFFFHNIYVLLK